MTSQNEILEEEIRDFMCSYRSRVVSGLQNTDTQTIDDLSDKVAQQIQSGSGRIFAFGNGGSEAIAEHLVYSLERRISDEFQFDTYSNPKLSEATDVDNALLFDQRIKRSGRTGNLAVLVSASGNSYNINNASLLCKEKGVETVAISRNGSIANNPKTKADYSVVIAEDDQQILEDITQSLLHVVVDVVDKKLTAEGIDVSEIEEVKRDYAQRLEQGYRSLDAALLQKIVFDIMVAYAHGDTVRIDGPDNGGMAISAGHTAHNLKWDALYRTNRPKNRVYTGIPPYHLTGVGNDGGDGFNYAVEVGDNGTNADVQIIFARDLDSKQTRSLNLAAFLKGVLVYPFCFDLGDEFAEADVAQMTGHTIGRILNTYLLLEQGTIREDQFEECIHRDLALLREKEKTRERLERIYEG